jgi:hypothetical protein
VGNGEAVSKAGKRRPPLAGFSIQPNRRRTSREAPVHRRLTAEEQLPSSSTESESSVESEAESEEPRTKRRVENRRSCDPHRQRSSRSQDGTPNHDRSRDSGDREASVAADKLLLPNDRLLFNDLTLNRDRLPNDDLTLRYGEGLLLYHLPLHGRLPVEASSDPVGRSELGLGVYGLPLHYGGLWDRVGRLGGKLPILPKLCSCITPELLGLRNRIGNRLLLNLIGRSLLNAARLLLNGIGRSRLNAARRVHGSRSRNWNLLNAARLLIDGSLRNASPWGELLLRNGVHGRLIDHAPRSLHDHSVAARKSRDDQELNH